MEYETWLIHSRHCIVATNSLETEKSEESKVKSTGASKSRMSEIRTAETVYQTLDTSSFESW